MNILDFMYLVLFIETYTGEKEGLVVYTMMFKLGYPVERMMEVSFVVNVVNDKV